MVESADVQLLARVWAALAEGDFAPLEDALAPDARWRAVQDGPWNCDDRRRILDVMRSNLAAAVRGRVEAMVPHGERVVVAFRPEQPFQGERPLDDGIAYMVVTVSAAKIVELKGCADRAAAEAYARSGDAPISGADAVAAAAAGAIRTGDVDALRGLLDEHPGLAAAALQGSRTALHVATDWPGYFPNGPAIVRLLLDAGADPDAAATGRRHAETPLHWAASSDDVDVAEVLIDGGANIEAPGGSIAGTPLANAVGYGCWHVARLLVARGAHVQWLWQAAALGLQARVEEFFAATPPPTPKQVTEAFWQACHGGQRRTAEYLLARGAQLDGFPGYSDEHPLDVAGSPDTRREALVTWLRERGATSGKG